MNVTVIQADSEWVVLEASIDGAPAATQRRSISAAALAAGSLTLADEKAALMTDVQAAYTRWLAVQQALQTI